MAQTVWITGHNGFLGRHLTEHVCAQESVSLGGIGRGNGATVLPTSINASVSEESLEALNGQTGSPHHIFHLAGGASVARSLSDSRGDFLDTVDSTSRLLNWAVRTRSNARIVLISSAAVYGTGHQHPIGEDSPTNPTSPYGAHKLAIEQMAQAYSASFKLNLCRLRLFSVYGPGLRKQLVYELFRRIEKQPDYVELQGTGEEYRDWIYVEDAVRAIWNFREAASTDCPAINIGSGEPRSVKSMADAIAKVVGSPTQFRYSGKQRPGDPDYLVADTTRLSTSNFRSKTSLEEGLRRVLRWLKETDEPSSSGIP